MASTEVVVIGGGVIGTAVAYHLSRRGRRVVLCERAGLGTGTSGACDGGVLPLTKQPGRHLQLALQSAELYAGLSDELGYDVEFDRHGCMVVAENEAHLDLLADLTERQRRAGLAVQLLDAAGARELQPHLARQVAGAAFSPGDGQVNPVRLCRGFAAAARRYGAELRLGQAVTGIEVAAGRVRGVYTSGGGIAADLVINCAGVWAPAVAAMAGLSVPIEPVRGQLLVTERVPPLVRGEVLSALYIAAKWRPELITGVARRLRLGLSVSQGRAGNLFIGGCREQVGFDTATTAAALGAIADRARTLLPVLAGLRVIRSFAGLRPTTPDGLPLVGFVPAVEGLCIAAGHGGDGNALAPVTGLLVADLIDGKAAPALSAALSPARFAA